MSFLAPIASMDASLSFAALAVIKATFLFTAAWAATLLLRRRSAALRHLLWSLAIGGAVVLPAVMALSPVALPVLPARPATVESDRHQPEAQASHAPRETSFEKSTTRSAADGEPAAERAAPTLPLGAGTTLVALWLVGAIALLARFLIGVYQVRGVVSRAALLHDATWSALARRVDADATRTTLHLRVSDEVDMPFASGIITPTIILPVSSEEWTVERREAVLLHEVAHLSRGDLLMNALSQVARAVYWFNPLAWYASHRLRIEGERACDDAVLRRGARASDYADHLLSIASGAGSSIPTAALAMARPSAFEGRLLAILEPGIERSSPSRLRVAATTAAFLIVILPLAAASPVAQARAMGPEQEPGTQVASTQPTQRVVSAVPALIEALSDASANVRLAAVSSLGSLQDPRAIAALGKALREDNDPRVREAAAQALGEIDDPRGVPHLLDALKSERVPAVREQIVEALREIDDPSAVAGVAALTKDPSPAVRRAVVSALGEFEDQSAVPAIISMARDEDIEVRRHVADALGNMENAAAFDALVTLTRDSDAEVRANAVNALGNLEDSRSLSALVVALKDASAEVRSQAADAIHNIPDLQRAPPALIDALADPDKDVRHNVAHALGEIGDEAAVPALKRALSDTNADARRAVAESLSEIGGAEAITALMGLLKDQDPEIRRIAAEALGKRR